MYYSLQTAMRHIDKHVNPKRLKFSETLAIDEFKKSNLGYGKYALIFCNLIEKKIIDVMKKEPLIRLTPYNYRNVFYK